MKEYLVYFTHSTGGFHVRVRIERNPRFPPYHGVLCKGREMTKEEAFDYAYQHISHHPRRNDYHFSINPSGLFTPYIQAEGVK